MKKIYDPVTGGDYNLEKKMYMRYHGLTEDEADLVMAAQTYAERDRVFNEIIASKQK